MQTKQKTTKKTQCGGRPKAAQGRRAGMERWGRRHVVRDAAEASWQVGGWQQLRAALATPTVSVQGCCGGGSRSCRRARYGESVVAGRGFSFFLNGLNVNCDVRISGSSGAEVEARRIDLWSCAPSSTWNRCTP